MEKPHDQHIGSRLKAFRERSKMVMPKIAENVNISKETLYAWERGTKPTDLNKYFRLKAFLDKMEGNLDEEQWKLETQKPVTLRLPLINDGPAMPQTVSNVAAGMVVFSENKPELMVERISAPFLGHVEGAIEVRGDSMEPTFSQGCRVVVTRLTDFKLFEDGKCYYIIDRNCQKIIRRVYRGKNKQSIKLVSDHKDQALYPPFERRWDEIITILKIIASVNPQNC